MQNDRVGYSDEVEPRSIPKPAAKFDARPFPVVPEVSLILEKSQQINKMSDPVVESIPELRLTSNGYSPYRSSESYAAWKEKQFPRQSITKSSNQYQIHSSTQNGSALHNFPSFNPSRKCSNLNCKDPNCHCHSSDDESPRSYHVSRSSGNESSRRYQTNYRHDESPRSYGIPKSSRDDYLRKYDPSNRPVEYENPNKYTKNQARSHNEMERHVNSNEYNTRSHNRDERVSPNERRQSRESNYSREPEPEPYDTRQKPRIYRSASYSDPHTNRNSPIEYDHQSKYSRSLQPFHQNPEHSHPGCCTNNHVNSNQETETVKNLLLVITSQNEQIKHLQKQVERLLKLHEQTLRDRKQCTCQPNGIVYQNTQMYDQSRSTNLPLTQNNMVKDSERCFSDMNMLDEKTKKTILEQKVSIGVMTSFELKVQNNPPLAKDNEIKQKNNQEKVLSNIGTSNIIKSLVNDTGEMIRKKKSNYLPATALENISEASESHMSSLRQSHANADSTRQSIEAQESIEVQNTNFYKQNRQENDDRVHRISVPRKRTSTPPTNNVRDLGNLNYDIEEQRYEQNQNEVREPPTYQYNFEYDNPRSSPHEDLHERKTNEFKPEEPMIADIIKMKNMRSDNIADDCLSLSSGDLDVDDLNPPSPEPSIHLDMQEFSDEGGSLPPQQAQKVGWTLYNNVLDQVNQILQNSNPLDEDDAEEQYDGMRSNRKRDYDNNAIMDTVKAATLEQLTKLGISFSDNADQREPQYNKKVVFDASCYQRQGPEAHLATASASIETNTSMHMKALAMKYLNDDQLADMQKTRPGIIKQGSAGIQNSNMSFATMHYLQRYHLLPGNASPKRDMPRDDYRGQMPVVNERMAIKTAERRAPSPHRYPPFQGNSKASYPSKILDISTLKQQPKLL